MPYEEPKPCIKSYKIEYRPEYIFGISYNKKEEKFCIEQKKHEAFVNLALDFINGIHSPIVNAYRKFIESWEPESEIDNRYIQFLKSDNTSKFIFTLSSDINFLLHDDESIKNKYEQSLEVLEDNCMFSQCAITGKNKKIAEFHNKIKGIVGGNSSGNLLVCYNNDSEMSYNKTGSCNSNVSEEVMSKYTEVLNYLLSSDKNKKRLDDITVVYWAMSEKEEYDSIFSLLEEDNQINSNELEEILNGLFKDAIEGNILNERLPDIRDIKPDVDFYIVGLKPNSSRTSLKFIYKKKFGEIISNIIKHQDDLKITGNNYPIKLWQIKKELISPKTKNELVNPALIIKIYEAIIMGTNYPSSLLYNMIRRMKIDNDKDISIISKSIRVGIIKACINRKARLQKRKEELNMALDIENTNQAYLCGRLFATLEKIQQDSANDSLNKTIKDSYFASASSTPSIIFPRLIKLSQYHASKLKNNSSIYWNKYIENIMAKFDNGFPTRLNLEEQGKFMVGYYQQMQEFFKKKEERVGE